MPRVFEGHAAVTLSRCLKARMAVRHVNFPVETARPNIEVVELTSQRRIYLASVVDESSQWLKLMQEQPMEVWELLSPVTSFGERANQLTGRSELCAVVAGARLTAINVKLSSIIFLSSATLTSVSTPTFNKSTSQPHPAGGQFSGAKLHAIVISLRPQRVRRQTVLARRYFVLALSHATPVRPVIDGA